MANSQSLKPNPDGLKKNIDHIVVLMMENHSFDNMLGWLYDKQVPLRGQSFDGLNENMWNPLDNIDSNGNPFTERVFVRKNGQDYKIGHKTVKNSSPNFTLPNPDPGEGFADTTYQLYGTYKVDADNPPLASMQGFVNNYKNAQLYGTYRYQDKVCDPREIMTCYTPDQLPVMKTLALQYAVCDQWFCSVPSQTLPNRDFFHAASSEGQVNNQPNASCSAKTIFNQIQDAIDNDKRSDLSWKVYSGSNKNEVFSLTRLIMTQLHDFSMNNNFQKINSFYEDAKAGKLPSYSFLEPQFHHDGDLVQNDMHPPSDVRAGEQMIADVYNALIASPNWEKTLFIITFDEHGGCFDHVAPPNYCKAPEASEPAGQNGFKFNRLGVRVPSIVVSPYIEKGTIARPAAYHPYEHTSVIRTIQECFDLQGHLTQRDANSVSLSGILNRDTARTDAEPIKAPSINATKNTELNDLHRIMTATLAQYAGKEIPSDDVLIEEMGKMYQEKFKK